jgi:hypothetical protein
LSRCRNQICCSHHYHFRTRPNHLLTKLRFEYILQHQQQQQIAHVHHRQPAAHTTTDLKGITFPESSPDSQLLLLTTCLLGVSLPVVHLVSRASRAHARWQPYASIQPSSSSMRIPPSAHRMPPPLASCLLAGPPCVEGFARSCPVAALCLYPTLF